MGKCFVKSVGTLVCTRQLGAALENTKSYGFPTLTTKLEMRKWSWKIYGI